MKCPNCGGEVSSQSLNCPFCGSKNPEGIAFYEEVQKKIERNKLLKPFLIKQKTPELVQKMLTRICIIVFLVNVLLFVGSFLIFFLGESHEQRTWQKDTFAARYYEEYDTAGNWDYECFLEKIQFILGEMEAGEVPEEYHVEALVRHAYDLISDAYDETDMENSDTGNHEAENTNQEEAVLMVYAFFQGYLGFDESQMSFLEPGEDGEYSYSMDSAEEEKVINLVLEKLEGMIK